MPFGGTWREVLNSDSSHYGGSGSGNFGGVQAQAVPQAGHAWRIEVNVPPLGVVLFEGTPS